MRQAYERGEHRVPGWEAESELSAQLELDMVSGSFPLFLYGSIMALSIALLESLLRELGGWIGRESGKDFAQFERSRRGAFLEGTLRFLRQECGVPVTVDSETWQALVAVRRRATSSFMPLGRIYPLIFAPASTMRWGSTGEAGLTSPARPPRARWMRSA